ncbi:MAG: hypothetical protein HZB68_01165 [Candidatus Aenigmarchaeota archaeon]|nr:hypothetical protein [Candidatus Aenigmarchaeota archaeon]
MGEETVKIKLDSSVALFALLFVSIVILAFHISIVMNGVTGFAVSAVEKPFDINAIQSTKDSIKALYPVEKIKSAEDAMAIVIPTGVPEYASKLPVSYGDGEKSLLVWVQVYQTTKLTPEQANRYINLATKPLGISCEFCCSVGPVGITYQGQLKCGCKHNPAAQGIAMWLIQNTDYTDAQVVREVLRWKAVWFPRNMVIETVKAAQESQS